MIEINERIEVDAPADTVWAYVSDPPSVAACITGCELGGQRDDGAYDATISIKFGGIRVQFRVVVRLEEDHDTRTGRIHVTGADRQGATKVNGTANFAVRDLGDATSAVDMDGRVDINGRLATIIASGATVVVSRLVGEFTACLTEKVGAASTPALAPSPVATAAAAAPTAPHAATAATQSTSTMTTSPQGRTAAPASWRVRLRAALRRTWQRILGGR